MLSVYDPGQYTAPVNQELVDVFGRTDRPSPHTLNFRDHPSNIDRLSEIIPVIVNSATLACHSVHIC